MLSKAKITQIQWFLRGVDLRLSVIFDGLSDPTRIRIFSLLLRYKDLCVTDIARILGVTVSAASQQLRILEMTGLIRKNRAGQMTCYTVEKSSPIVRTIARYLVQKHL
ncbi:winged helix-turn-helix transcriptional regulator [Candidatus Roizmanbacteria bacterium]|nr:winged helix-turn-helix transcriptional regulator [Candidatus Roizmanbacteria bacterium]